MKYTDFIQKLEELVNSEDLLEVSNEISELRSKFDDYVLEEERKLQVAQLEAEDEGVSIPEPEGDFGKEEFYNIYNEYRSKRKEIVEARTAEETRNLNQKKALIKQLEELITTEENIGAAFASFKEIQEKWKTIGDIPRNNRNEIQSAYSKAIEDFFYTINIYKEIKEHDLHRNYQLKSEVIERLKGLRKEESVKELEHQLKTIQNDWEDIGPVPNDQWEQLKDAYWTEVRSIYDRINRFYDDRRSEQKENIDKKKALIEETTGILEGISDVKTVKSWENATKQLLEIQNRWKGIGFGPKKENDQVWKEFRAKCDEFFTAKKAFFDVVQVEFDAVADKKKELIDQAIQLKDSTDWHDTSKKLINLQKRWKQLGHSGRKNEQKLWKQFRGACDEFFTAKQKFFEAEEEQYQVNLDKKKAVIQKIDGFKLPSDKNEALQSLKEFANEFNEIGHVPRADKDTVYKDFKAALDKHYGALKLEGAEKDRIMFKAKLDTLNASPQSDRQLNNLRSEIRKEIDHLKKEIIQLETNLGFFANSKGADKLKADVQKKIDSANKKIDEAKDKLKMIPR